MSKTREATLTDLQNQAMEEIRRRLVGCFQYIDLASAQPLYFITVGYSGWVLVLGHPEHGSYEWAARVDGAFREQTEVFYEHSDCGWGEPALAMREALNKMLDY